MSNRPDPTKLPRALLIKYIYKTEQSPPGIEPSTRDHWLKCLNSWREMQNLKKQARESGGSDELAKIFAKISAGIGRSLGAIKAEARMEITKIYLLPRLGDGFDGSKMSIMWAIQIQNKVFGTQNSHSDLIWMGTANRTPGTRRIKWEPSEEHQKAARQAWNNFKAELKREYNNKK